MESCFKSRTKMAPEMDGAHLPSKLLLLLLPPETARATVLSASCFSVCLSRRCTREIHVQHRAARE